MSNHIKSLFAGFSNTIQVTFTFFSWMYIVICFCLFSLSNQESEGILFSSKNNEEYTVAHEEASLSFSDSSLHSIKQSTTNYISPQV